MYEASRQEVPPGVDPETGQDPGGGAGDRLLGAPAGVVETHVSVLFFMGDRVYKLRKPVAFDFLDFRDRMVRQSDCHREVALNRRLAPDVYIGVADIAMDGTAVDHMVVMRRMPPERRLGLLAREGADLGGSLRQTAKKLANFHSRAARSSEVSSVATGAALRAGWESNFVETQRFVGTILDADTETEIHQLADRWIAGREPLLRQRIASGCVCDGHGDLQAEDIFCLDDGVRILDCVEFSDRLRYGDVCADVAFLVMDLERLGRPEAAVQFLADYEEYAGDSFPDSLVHHYCAARAYIRAKVSCLRAAQGVADAEIEARQLQALALDHLRRSRVTMVVVGGLPGSGKSTLAAGLGTAREWAVLRSDDIRWEMGRTEAEQEARGYLMARYSPTHTATVYKELLRRAERSVEHGISVILDASWIDARWRDDVRALARRTSSDLVEFCCEAPADEAEIRILRRLNEHGDVSEATPAVRSAMEESMDPWPTATVIRTSERTPEETLAEAMDEYAMTRSEGLRVRAGDRSPSAAQAMDR